MINRVFQLDYHYKIKLYIKAIIKMASTMVSVYWQNKMDLFTKVVLKMENIMAMELIHLKTGLVSEVCGSMG